MKHDPLHIEELLAYWMDCLKWAAFIFGGILFIVSVGRYFFGEG